MKKLFCIIFLTYFSTGTTIKAEKIRLQKVSDIDMVSPFNIVEIGVRFMPTFSSLDVKTASGGIIKGGVTLGYGLGALVGINLTDHIGIQGEVIYNSLSQKFKDQDMEREIKISYINVPLLLSLNSGKSKRVNFNVVVGPQFGLNVGSSISGATGSSSDTLQTVLAIKKNDFGLAYGAGLEFGLNTLKTVRLDLGFRGVYGFTNVSEANTAASSKSYYTLDQASVKTYSGYIGIAFLF